MLRDIVAGKFGPKVTSIGRFHCSKLASYPGFPQMFAESLDTRLVASLLSDCSKMVW